ncbi:PilZ domain-containing protein [Leptospira sp. 96542]|nr:PilZ domain-containing protein [Leptospira sp. 96542]
MLETRAKQRIKSMEWEDFTLKVFSIDGEPEYLLARIENISELGVSGIIEAGTELPEKSMISGIIESDLTRSRIRYSGKIVWTKDTEVGIQFGVKFTEEFLLPDVIIARSMAAA